jgi:cysteine desulfurase
LEQGILAEYSEAVIFYKDQERLPHCTAIAFPAISNEALLHALNRQHLYACIGGGGFQQIGLLLIPAGVDTTFAHSAINFSLSRETTEEDIDQAIEIVVDSAKRLHKASAHLFKEV